MHFFDSYCIVLQNALDIKAAVPKRRTLYEALAPITSSRRYRRKDV